MKIKSTLQDLLKALNNGFYFFPYLISFTSLDFIYINEINYMTISSYVQNIVTY